jgi:hypothetical protein
VLAAFGARLEARGERVLSEREILAAERAAGERLYSADLGRGRFHRADLVRLALDGPEAIEVELSAKGAARLDALLRGWRFAVAEGRIARVVYHCPDRTRQVVEKALARTATAPMVEVTELVL